MIQHQYWVTKKSVQRKLGGKEDECIVSSDAELDAKLELFRSISESCIHLQRVIDLYQERLCNLAQEENTLGRYMKECGKNEKNAHAGQILSSAGKALAYMGHQRLTLNSPLVRLHHEVETFRGRAVSDTRATVAEMEKARTEYRAALSWMKSASAQLDPDTGHGLDKFRKAQSYVKTSKARFDKMMLACLQKVDLLAAARCNMFSHALIAYQKGISTFSTKASETLGTALKKLNAVESSQDLESVEEIVDKDRNTFFNSEYSDKPPQQAKRAEDKEIKAEHKEDLLVEPTKEEDEVSNVDLLQLNLGVPEASDLLGDFMPSNFIQEGLLDFSEFETHSTGEQRQQEQEATKKRKEDKSDAHMNWLSLFKELDPLENEDATGSMDRA